MLCLEGGPIWLEMCTGELSRVMGLMDTLGSVWVPQVHAFVTTNQMPYLIWVHFYGYKLYLHLKMSFKRNFKISLPHSPMNHCLHFLKPTLHLNHWRTEMGSSSCRHVENFRSKGLQSSALHGYRLIACSSRDDLILTSIKWRKKPKVTKSVTCAYKEKETLSTC